MIIKAKKNEKAKPEAKKLDKKQTNKSTTKINPPKKAADDSKRVYHVSKREDGQWQVKFAGGEKAIKLFKTQKEALDYALKLCENKDDGSTVMLHGLDGKIRKY